MSDLYLAYKQFNTGVAVTGGRAKKVDKFDDAEKIDFIARLSAKLRRGKSEPIEVVDLGIHNTGDDSDADASDASDEYGSIAGDTAMHANIVDIMTNDDSSSDSGSSDSSSDEASNYEVETATDNESNSDIEPNSDIELNSDIASMFINSADTHNVFDDDLKNGNGDDGDGYDITTMIE
jgi:hypothetical protein